MPILHIILGIFWFSSTLSKAAPTTYPEHNCSIEFPPNWRVMDVPPSPALAFAHSPDGIKAVTVTALHVEESQQFFAVRDMIAGAKSRAADDRWQIITEQRVQVGDIPWEYFKAKIAETATVGFYCTSIGNEAYMLQVLSKEGDVQTDTELDSIIASFQPLVRPETPISAPKAPSTAYRVGYVAGRVLFLMLVGVGIMLVIKKGRKRPSGL